MGRAIPHSAASPAPAGLDFTYRMRLLCGDVAARLPEFRHVDLELVALRICQTRSGAMYGVHASLTPLRFQHGERTQTRRGRTWTIQSVRDADGREMLYLLSFYLPRFCNQPLAEKLATVMHELWHVSPSFDGDVRRLPGRCFAHGHSEESFHGEMRALANTWLSLSPPRELYAFLECDFQALRSRFRTVFGTKIPTPKLILVPGSRP